MLKRLNKAIKKGRRTFLNSTGRDISAIKTANRDPKLDGKIKELLSNKELLALILKHSIRELSGYSNLEIVHFIEGNVEVGTHKVMPHFKDKITGLRQDNFEFGAVSIVFDLKFNMVLPTDCEGEYREVIINLEAQNQFNPGYDIAKRGIYYCARLISEQLTSLKKPAGYNSLKKVYSIWLLTEPPKKQGEADSITEFKMGKDKIYGDFQRDVEFDLLSMIFICLGKNSNNKMIKAMEKTLDVRSKEDEIKKELEDAGVTITTELAEGVSEMCNLSERAIRYGLEEGEIKGTIKTYLKLRTDENLILKDLMQEYNLTLEDAQDCLAQVKKDLAN